LHQQSIFFPDQACVSLRWIGSEWTITRADVKIRTCRVPRLKTLEEFDFNQARQIPAAKIRELAEGGYIERAEPVVFMGECGTGKTHRPQVYAWPRADRNDGRGSPPPPIW
jgi:hypothetical protein